jgi:hypothetical protein
MSGRSAVMIAVAGNGIVLCLSWVGYGWNWAGVHGAARNTARFSEQWFLAGFLAPGLVRWIRRWPAETDLLQAFVAAPMVHYGSVLAVLAFDPAQVLHHPIAAGVAIAGGFWLVLGLGLTARPRASALYGYLHRFLLYVIFRVFFVGLLNDRFRPFRGLAAGLGLGLILRLTRHELCSAEG